MEKINFENLPSTNTPINANNLNQLQNNVEEAIDLIHPIGSIHITNTNTNPESIFGGTWTLIDKGLTHTIYDEHTDVLVTPTDNATISTAVALVTESVIFMRVDFVTAIDLGDSAVDLFTINWSALGISKITYDLKMLPVGTDGAKVMPCCRWKMQLVWLHR